MRDLSLRVSEGETVALVGESGSGKSVTSLGVTRLIDHAGGRITGGSIRFRDRAGTVRDLARESQEAMRRLRGPEIAMIFQEPMTSLNPVLRVGDQIAEAVMLHQGLGRRAAREEARRMLERVRIPEAARQLDRYPFQLSGGMRQRVMIAMALSCRPRLLIADEPTTALDVTVQAQVLRLIHALQRELGMGMIFITHDMGVVAEIADRVVVMRAGEKVEEADVFSIFERRSTPTRARCSPPCRCSAACRADAAGAVPATVRRGRRRRRTRCAARRCSRSRISRRGSRCAAACSAGVRGRIHAVEQVSLAIRAGETLGLVGESGCGKSTTGRSIIRLEQPASGRILLGGQDVTQLDRDARGEAAPARAIRLPGPVRLARSAPDRRLLRRRADPSRTARDGRRGAAPRRRAARAGRAAAAVRGGAIRTSSRAASASASASPARSPASPS